MSSVDYDLHMAQKYRLAISISILKTKPDNLSIDEYLDQIKNIINEKNTDDELNISACSDDFNIDNDDTINENLNLNHTKEINEIVVNEPVLNNNTTQAFGNITKVDGIRAQVNSNRMNFNENGAQVNLNRNNVNGNRRRVNENDTQVNDYTTKVDDNETVVTDNETQDLTNSKSLLNNFKETNVEVNLNEERKNKCREIIQVMNGVNVETTLDKNIIKENIQPICAYVHNKPFNDMDLTQCYDDNDSIFQSINTFEEARRSGYEQSSSSSQNNIEKSTIINVQETKQKDIGIDSNIALATEHINTNYNAKLMKRTNLTERAVSKPKIAKVNSKTTRNNKKTEAVKNTNKNQVTTNISGESKNSPQDSNKDTNDKARAPNIDTQETLIYIHPDNTQFDTHYSESQAKEIVIDNKLIYSKPKSTNKEMYSFNTIVNDTELYAVTQRSQTNINLTENNTGLPLHTKTLDELPIRETQDSINAMENETAFPSDIQMDEPRRPEPSKNAIENYTAFSQYAQNIDYLDTVELCNATKKDNTNFDKTNTKVNDKDFESDKTISQTDKNHCTGFDKTNINDSCINSDGNPNDIDDDDLTDDTEKIPFKIIEEMNKIKMYMNKGNERMDFSSGYKSSQSRCSYKSTQLTSMRIEQSADCIFNYLSSCSLLSPTQELIEQISEMLGQLIDRLHDEETYPQFLEELLSTVDKLLKLVYEAENYDCHVLLKKDEQIQRIILLNKSTHIQKYTIEKINTILQQLLDEISADDSTYEIQNINKIENVCYIFHILRVILPKYSTNYSSTQNSQEDEKVLRKTDITDLWRKKWIPNFKETSVERSFENKCVLKDCSAILNKIIVSSMDGYSLIAFSALQCFNMLQS